MYRRSTLRSHRRGGSATAPVQARGQVSTVSVRSGPLLCAGASPLGPGMSEETSHHFARPPACPPRTQLNTVRKPEVACRPLVFWLSGQRVSEHEEHAPSELADRGGA